MSSAATQPADSDNQLATLVDNRPGNTMLDATKHRAFWGNDQKRIHAVWLNVGFKVEAVDQRNKSATFARIAE